MEPVLRALLLGQLTLLLVFAALLSGVVALPASAEGVEIPLFLACNLATSVACFLAARTAEAPEYGKAWRYLGFASVCYLLGNVAWFVPSLVALTWAGLSAVDLICLCFYPFALLAAVSWPRRKETGTERLSLWLDSAVLVVGAGMAVWLGLADAVLRSVSAQIDGVSGSLLYPFADLVLLFAVMMVTRHPATPPASLSGGLIATALVVTSVGDIGLALALMSGESRGGVVWPQLVYLMSSILLTAAAVAFRTEARGGFLLWPRFRSLFNRLPRLSFLVPAIAAGSGFAFLVYEMVHTSNPRAAGLVVGASLLLLLGGWRTLLAERSTAAKATELAATLDALRASQKEAERERDKAEQALQAKNQFFAVMGHEIRTPLNAVIGMSQLLLATSLQPSQRESAEVIRQGGDALLAVVNDLLDFSKMEAGHLEIEQIPLNPGRTIERLITLMRPTAAARQLTLELTLRDLPVVALGDEARLGQILLNLLANAIKFSAEGTIHVAARATPTAEGFDLEISVSDPGIGIPADKIPLLFQPFSQLSPGLSRSYGGTGLGLAICKRLAEMMGGSIRAESEPGKGSVFTFHVLLVRPSRLTTVPVPPLIPGLAQHRGAASDLKVLIIEDNPVNRQVLSMMITALGHSADMVEDGQSAIARVGTSRYDLILTDLMLPEMDGIETSRRLRLLTNGQDALIVAVTAAATVEDRERCLAAGMDGFLAKPFTIDALRNLLERYGSARSA